MKKLVITCMLLSATLATFAQKKADKTKVPAATAQGGNNAMAVSHDLTAAEKKSAEQKAEKTSKTLQAKLGLTQDQYQKVYEAQARYEKNYAKYPAGKIPSGFLSNITSERNSLVQQAITPEQYEQYSSMNMAK